MNLRRMALDALRKIADQGAYANLTLKEASNGLSVKDARWLSALVYTTLDHLYTIEFYIAQYCKTRPKPVIYCILRLGICELLYFQTPAHHVVTAYVSLTRELGKDALSGFVNATLRTIEKEKDALPPITGTVANRLSLTYSYPEWLVSLWLDQYGEAFTTALLSTEPSPMEIRAQYPFETETLRAALPVKSAIGKLDDNCLVLEHGMDVASFPLFQQGCMTVQGQSAMLACRGLGDCYGLTVLDACASPGGKSAYIASLSENTVDLTCFELHEHRTELLKKTLARLGVSATVEQRDASVYDASFEQAFNKVLIDAPCSGLGLLSDKPDIRYRKTDEDITALVEIQKSILDTCCRYVQPGGTLLYATCTISKRENQDMVDGFLASHANFQLEPMPLTIDNSGMLQLFPNVHGVDGFFLARMKRCI